MALDLLRRTVTDNPFIPVSPTEPQAVFLTVPVTEVLYGGAGGGGKSVALLMAALQYVQVPGYAALLLRRTFPELNGADGLIPLSQSWLGGTGAKWSEKNHQWTFPSGATLTFGYLETERDKFRYKGPSYQFIGFDELTGFLETQYRFLFQRLRRKLGLPVPLRMRAGTNPGDVGHEWVKARFIDSDEPDRLFVPAKLEDNPHLDAVSYDESLSKLDPVTRAQFRHGDWDVRPEGNLFKRAWFAGKVLNAAPECLRWVRYWDLAATPEADGNDPDYAAGVRMGMTPGGEFVIDDVVHRRGTPREIEAAVASTARRDGYDVAVRIEQEPGSSGKLLIDAYRRGVLMGYDLQGVRSTGDKVTRSGPFSSACEAGLVYLVRGAWVEPFLDELCAFPQVAHDDQVDGATGAHAALTRGGREWTPKDWETVFATPDDVADKSPAQLLREKLARGRLRT